MSGEESPGEPCLPPKRHRTKVPKQQKLQRSYRKTTSVNARATQGKTSPSAFSSRVNPGHSISYAIDPLSNTQRQVRHVPLRHDDRIGASDRKPAFSSDSSDRASNRSPDGSKVTEKTETSGIQSSGLSDCSIVGISSLTVGWMCIVREIAV